MPIFEVIEDRLDREEGGHVITVKYENRRITCLHPDGHIDSEWWVPEKNSTVMKVLPSTAEQAVFVTEELRRCGWPSAGIVLRTGR